MVSKINRPTNLNVGLTGVDRWTKQDDVHLPEETRAHPLFLPEPRPLDQILKRETLDERLARDVVPSSLTKELLEPSVLTATRKKLAERLLEAGMRAPDIARDRILAGAALLDEEVAMDSEVQEALAALLRG